MTSLFDFFVIVGGSTAVALLGMFLIRKRISRQVLESCHEVGGIMLAIVGTLYAILLGLIVVNSQTKVDTARQMAITESNMLSNIYHLSKTFNDDARHTIREHIHDYAVVVTSQDWTKVESNQEKEGTISAYQGLWQTVTAYEPKNVNETQCYATMISNLEELSAARKFRMVAAKAGLSPILWAVLITGGVGIVLFTYFFFLESMLAQVLMTAFVSIFLSMNVYLIWVYQNPYRTELGAKESGFGFSFSPKWFVDHSASTGKPGE
jgi:hypothetical protein